MIARLAELTTRAIAHLRELSGIRAIVLTLSITGIVGMVGKLLGDNESRIALWLGLSKSALYGIGLAVLVAVVVTIIVLERERIRKDKAMPDPGDVFDLEELVPIRERTPNLGKAISTTLIPALFPSATNALGSETMPWEEIDRAGAKNCYMAVGVYSNRDRRYVGYASFWPIKEETALRLIRGEITDSQLTADDVVPEAERHSCRYAIVPGIGVIGDNGAERVRRALCLMRTLRRMIAEQYLANRRSSMTIIAMAYSSHGAKWCQHYDMEPRGIADYGDGVPVQVCTKQVRAKDLV
ncbi:hypothetical protein AB2M62_12320 [Sphingomonas sp. MMS12-HWE2-04]|uniref:hypothetical protein n=1 Tax=Sphingomonas sp. MMS12-HWE2-04 TaxID=3234199 RepID=UPI00384E8F02